MSTKDQPLQLSVGGAGKTLPPQQWFVTEIQQMMHGLGDCRKPLQESAMLVEEITQQQMINLRCLCLSVRSYFQIEPFLLHNLSRPMYFRKLYKASDVASMRGTKLIGIEDILFLMRKDKVKLRRLLRYMDMKDMKAMTIRSASVDEEDTADAVDVRTQPVKKRRKLCYDFLSSIDQTGELLDLFEDDTEDDVKYERLLRAELRSRCLDPQQYLEFCVARQANFGRRYKSQKFKEWLLTGVNLDIKPGLPALEIISYLAYETVAQVVDLALLVKQDMQTSVADPLVRTTPSINHNLNETASMTALMGQTQKFPTLTSPTVSPPTTPSISGQSTPTIGSATTGPQLLSSGSKSKSKKKKKISGKVTLETPITKAIMTSDIHEAMRRYTNFIGPFASEMKVNNLTSPKMTLLSC